MKDGTGHPGVPHPLTHQPALQHPPSRDHRPPPRHSRAPLRRKVAMLQAGHSVRPANGGPDFVCVCARGEWGQHPLRMSKGGWDGCPWPLGVTGSAHRAPEGQTARPARGRRFQGGSVKYIRSSACSWACSPPPRRPLPCLVSPLPVPPGPTRIQRTGAGPAPATTWPACASPPSHHRRCPHPPPPRQGCPPPSTQHEPLAGARRRRRTRRRRSLRRARASRSSRHREWRAERPSAGILSGGLPEGGGGSVGQAKTQPRAGGLRAQAPRGSYQARLPVLA